MPKPRKRRARGTATSRSVGLGSPRRRAASSRSPRYRRPARAAAEKARRRKQEAHRQKRVDEAAKVCREVVTDGWESTVAERASKYVAEATIKELFGKHRAIHCQALADLAATTLEYKKKLHGLVGQIARWVVSLIGGGRLTQALARELASNLPLLTDAKFIAVARGAQLTGIMLCLADGRDLTRCQCFIDLALNETKTRIKQIMGAALHDWANLGNLVPPRTTRP